MNAEEAYLRCEAITRRNAANFYYGIRLLAPERRRAMCAVYAFARRIDDIGDGSLPSPRKLELLEDQAAALASMPGGPARAREEVEGEHVLGGPSARAREKVEGEHVSGGPSARAWGGGAGAFEDDPVLVALADAYDRFEVPTDAMPDLIEGVKMDVAGVSYESFEELVRYCRRVAGAIGRACLAIFALRDRADAGCADAYRLADDLGVALQLTNILRDIREDAHAGRVYLPSEDLRRFGLIAAGEEREAAGMLARLADARGPSGCARRVAGDDPGLEHTHAAAAADAEEAQWLDALVRFQAERAREWFDRGMALAPLLDRRSAACLLAMAGIYSRLLDRIESEPDRALRERVVLPVHEKALVAARGMLGARV
jgi:15-cis-phytoene synthase